MPGRLPDLPVQVGAVEALDDPDRAPHPEEAFDFFAYSWRSRCRERQDRCAEAPPRLPDPEIRRAEVVTPLADAVGLVHHQERNHEIPDRIAKRGNLETFGGHEKKLGPAFPGPGEDPPPLRGGKGRSEEIGLEAPGSSARHLVLHKGDQRAHHKDGSSEEEGGKLKTHALPSPRGEDADGVSAVQGSPDQGLLARPEVGMTEGAPEGGEEVSSTIIDRVD
jgi:hypothetical protein